MLAAEDRAGFGHDLLDERMADTRADGDPSVLADDLRHRPRDDEVVHHRLSGMAVEDARRDDGGRRGATDRHALVVDEEHPIGVAVEREPDVGVQIEDRSLQILQVLGLDRVGRVVRERAVELSVQDGQRERQPLEHAGDDEAAHAVGGVGHDRERLQRGRVDERAHVLSEGVEQVDPLHLARDLAPRRDAGRDHLLDL